MTAVLPGSRFPFPANGKEVKRSDARRQVVECYERMLQFYGSLQIQVHPASNPFDKPRNGGRGADAVPGVGGCHRDHHVDGAQPYHAALNV
jgi:hypothetical protein